MGRRRKISLKTFPDTDPERFNRDQQMFVEWMNGAKLTELARKYEMSLVAIKAISRKYDWRGVRKEMHQRQFARTLEKMDTMVFTIAKLLNEDLKRLERRMLEGDRKDITGDDRSHLLKMLGQFVKERRLEDGKPTEINSGPAHIVIELPSGKSANEFGVIPTTGQTVTMLEKSDEDEVERIELDVDELESAMDEQKDSEELDDEI